MQPTTGSGGHGCTGDVDEPVRVSHGRGRGASSKWSAGLREPADHLEVLRYEIVHSILVLPEFLEDLVVHVVINQSGVGSCDDLGETARRVDQQ